MIYFLHIPKTSGTSILRSTVRCFSDTLSVIKETETYQFILDRNLEQKDFETFLKRSVDKYDFFYGHYACSPHVFSNKIETFSIVREPFDRFLSCFRWLHKSQGNFYPIEKEYEWKESDFRSIEGFMEAAFNDSYSTGFDSTPNMQSANLVNEIEWSKNIPYLCSPKISFEQLLKIIKQKKITLSTFENRNYLINTLENSLNKIKNTNLKIDKNLKANFDERPKIDYKKILTKDLIQKINNQNKLDYYLYYYIKEFELKNGRSLSYKDIVI